MGQRFNLLGSGSNADASTMQGFGALAGALGPNSKQKAQGQNLLADTALKQANLGKVDPEIEKLNNENEALAFKNKGASALGVVAADPNNYEKGPDGQPRIKYSAAPQMIANGLNSGQSSANITPYTNAPYSAEAEAKAKVAAGENTVDAVTARFLQAHPEALALKTNPSVALSPGQSLFRVAPSLTPDLPSNPTPDLGSPLLPPADFTPSAKQDPQAVAALHNPQTPPPQTPQPPAQGGLGALYGQHGQGDYFGNMPSGFIDGVQVHRAQATGRLAPVGTVTPSGNTVGNDAPQAGAMAGLGQVLHTLFGNPMGDDAARNAPALPEYDNTGHATGGADPSNPYSNPLGYPAPVITGNPKSAANREKSNFGYAQQAAAAAQQMRGVDGSQQQPSPMARIAAGQPPAPDQSNPNPPAQPAPVAAKGQGDVIASVPVKDDTNKTESIRIQQAKADRQKEIDGFDNSISQLAELKKNSKSSATPLAVIPGFDQTAQAFGGQAASDRLARSQVANDLVLQAGKQMGGRLTDTDLKFLQKSVPSNAASDAVWNAWADALTTKLQTAKKQAMARGENFGDAVKTAAGPSAEDKSKAAKAGASPAKPSVVTQNGVTYTLQPNGEYL